MTRLEDLVAALEVRGAASEWVARSRQRFAGRVRHGPAAVYRAEHSRELTALVHRDSVTGRGSARFVLGEDVRSLDSTVDDALVRATMATGPGWRMAPAAAAARVEVADRAFTGEPRRTADELASRLEAACHGLGVRIDDAEAEVVRDSLVVATSQGFELEWSVTEVSVRGRLVLGARSRPIELAARRYANLDLRAAVVDGRRLVLAAAEAQPTPAGSYAIVFGPGALLAGGGLGVLEILAAHASADSERLGLGRYRVGQPIAPGAAAVAEPLTVISDGALPFGLRSSPLADDASPVRRFSLVDGGIARGVALDHREAALRRLPPNGGVRNLVVTAGTASRDQLLEGPALLIEDLGWFDLDLRTGELSASIALAMLHDDKGARPVTGGILRLDALSALALARRSATVVRRGPYQGPDLWRLPSAAVD